MIYQTKYNNVFPPVALECPNYWNSDKDGNGKTICYIPTGGVNTGTFNGKNVAGLGSNANGNFINFNDSNWGSTGDSATCTKSKWCIKNKIIWDGISNFNGCA